MSAIPFIDLAVQRRRLGPAIDAAIDQVLNRGDFIQGREVHALEAALSEFCGVAHCVTCANGTDALTLVAMVEELGPHDLVIAPAFTYVATAEAFRILGIPVMFADIECESFGIDPDSVFAAIKQARANGLKPRMIVAADLFGEPCDYARLQEIAAREGLILVADAAQSFGATLHGDSVGGLADWTTTSFFPAKPLGCYGDGGAVFVNDPEKAALLRSLAQHGKGNAKYDNVRVGLNSRLDTLQAAILLVKLDAYRDELLARDRAAQRYAALIDDASVTPRLRDGATSSWAQYTLRLPQRDAVKTAMTQVGVPTAVYYPTPLPDQLGYLDCVVVDGGAPNAAQRAAEVLSLPMHSDLAAKDQATIAAWLASARAL